LPSQIESLAVTLSKGEMATFEGTAPGSGCLWAAGTAEASLGKRSWNERIETAKSHE